MCRASIRLSNSASLIKLGIAREGLGIGGVSL
jgi:hypothetical protein